MKKEKVKNLEAVQPEKKKKKMVTSDASAVMLIQTAANFSS